MRNQATVSSNRLILLFFILLLFVLIVPQSTQAAPGVDGSMTVTSMNTVLNRYTTATSIVGNDVTVNDIADLNDGSGHYNNNALSSGDMILIYQAQGASFADVSESPSYGAFTYNDAGQYEFAVVSSVSGNTITIDNTNSTPYSCGDISSYNGPVQVVRVPQYTDITVNAGASVVANSWDGSMGGVVAVVAQTTLTMNGSIDVSGQGFRGGAVDNSSNYPSTNTGYRNTSASIGARKGESILGYIAQYDANNGRYGRGAPANGGGGGVAHNSAGGGGANGNNGGTWTGNGNPDLTTPGWISAWDIDDGAYNGGVLPTYFINGAGGGRGGYDYGSSNQDALIIAPGDPAWGGNNRRQNGGLGGRPMANAPDSRVFFGGGGGAGDGNNSNSGPGGAGGGLIILTANTLTGSGQILANGNNGGVAGTSDAAGGAGAGGSIIVQANNVSGISVTANGGIGGSQPATTQVEGPGGGGGGGFVAIDTNSGSLTTSILGGANGITGSSLVTEFIPNGATQAFSGASTTVGFSFPGCTTPTAVTLNSFSAPNQIAGQVALMVTVLILGIGSLWLRRRVNR